MVDREKIALREFKNRSVPYIKHIPATDIEWLCLMQHHGCPTRLLDFTTNPLIAIFFAAQPPDDIAGQLIMATYTKTYEPSKSKSVFDQKSNFAYHPPHITERIIGQSGCFVFCGTPNKPLDSRQCDFIEIPADKKWRTRDELKTMGITYSSLFPGIDGICKDLNELLVSQLATDELLS